MIQIFTLWPHVKQADPLILPVDLLAPYLPLRVLTDAHLAAVPDPPTLFALMYERGAGEGTGKERERDGECWLRAIGLAG